MQAQNMTDEEIVAEEIECNYCGYKCFCGQQKQMKFPCCWGCWGRLPLHYKHKIYGKQGDDLIAGVLAIKKYLEENENGKIDGAGTAGA